MEKEVIVIFFNYITKTILKNHYINNALKENLQTSKSKPIYIRKKTNTQCIDHRLVLLPIHTSKIICVGVSNKEGVN